MKCFLDFAHGTIYKLQSPSRMVIAPPIAQCLVDGMTGGPKRIRGPVQMTMIRVLLANEDAYAKDTEEGEND